MALSREGRVTLKQLREKVANLNDQLNTHDGIDLVRVLIDIAEVSSLAVGLKRDVAHAGDVGDA